jgi:hypothetical protein
LSSNLYKYRWFSLEPYIRPIKSSFINVDYILDILSNKRERAYKIYKELLEGNSVFEYRTVLQDANAVRKFFDRCLSWFKENMPKIKLERGEIFTSYFELEKQIESIRGKKRFNKPDDRKAILYLIEQLISSGYNIEDIAERLNMSRATVYRILK